MISLSGIDNSGKSTQIELLENYFKKKGKKIKIIWGRGGWTPGLEFVKNLVRTDKNLDPKGREEYRNNIHANPYKKKILLIGAILDLYLFFGIYYRLQIILGYEVICDRYIWDTYVDFKVNYSMIDFEKWYIWKILLKIIPYPQKSIIIVLTPEESIRRGINKQEFYLESLEVKRQKIALYYNLITKGRWTKHIDGAQSKDLIFRDIIMAIEK
jgi:thymidylate kinase